MKPLREHIYRRSLRSNRVALTLLEMMVAVTLLVVIMLGLLAMFNQTQKVLHIANAQTDVFENARGAIQMLSQDLTEMTLYPDTNFIRSSEARTYPSPASPLSLGGTNLLASFGDVFWLTRLNNQWEQIGYFVADDPVRRTNYGVGTLYRFSTNAHGTVSPQLMKTFTSAEVDDAHRVSDGIVHFVLTAVFVRNSGSVSNVIVDFFPANNYVIGNLATAQMLLPAFVDIELGVLEPQTLKQFQALKDVNIPVAKDFLRNHAAQIHFFRERVPIRNFINPYRENEVP